MPSLKHRCEAPPRNMLSYDSSSLLTIHNPNSRAAAAVLLLLPVYAAIFKYRQKTWCGHSCKEARHRHPLAYPQQPPSKHTSRKTIVSSTAYVQWRYICARCLYLLHLSDACPEVTVVLRALPSFVQRHYPAVKPIPGHAPLLPQELRPVFVQDGEKLGPFLDVVQAAFLEVHFDLLQTTYITCERRLKTILLATDPESFSGEARQHLLLPDHLVGIRCSARILYCSRGTGTPMARKMWTSRRQQQQAAVRHLWGENTF